MSCLLLSRDITIGIPQGDVLYPRIDSFNVTMLPTSGGTIVGTGIGISGCTSVNIGEVSGSFVVNSDTQITITVPEITLGVKNVVMVTPQGTITNLNAITITDKVLSYIDESSRNSGADISIIKNGSTIKQLNVDYTGNYTGTNVPAPAKSSIKTVEAIAHRMNIIKWNMVPLAEWYDVYRNDVKINTEDIVDLEYIDSTIEDYTSYSYKVIANNRIGDGIFSEIVTIQTLINTFIDNSVSTNRTVINSNGINRIEG